MLEDVRVWGLTFFCGWACDIMRGFRRNAGERGFYNVAVDGLTTAQLDNFLATIKRQCSKNVVIKEGFPWALSTN
ncbi:hypothetical protein PRIPAC_89934 [Pristionchus pacificus]|uniref:Uncharacterized protein n=1 Tax=Pristionchus pacificus TaxID=54126 RepID=A0A2A6B8Z0_PRIPA|nr:hypothetical protein PRIPAC_89934 [Pristionchus pacificus]|eukprot:PDM62336.1 hypothetical protein PRIPAC_51778 [Pristionchus pacificus]